ncbi:DUF4199 domain-containing protein [uncultured Aquimarina sp.]|uniref:DUF4199 domain-containing protein n=1 Tax=uncultured Aquimarina sp. TaxID=575652 RepID=UPI00260C92BE|nr:DUF4199 domain-containing protein [uncultured Aquimarina sp.]
MKSKSIPIKNYILKYGLLCGIATIIFNFLTYLSGNYTKQNLFHVTIFLLITSSSVILGMIMFKKANDNYINLREALKIGIAIAVIGGFLTILWKILLIKVIDPEIITQLEDKQIKLIAENSANFTQENIEKQIAITRKYSSPIIQIGANILENLLVGTVFGLIGGLIIRKKRDPFN